MGELQNYFLEYISAVQPADSNRAAAITHHHAVRDRLAGDSDFAEWHAGDFLYGSYRRNTAIQPIKDVDVCILLDIDPSVLNDANPNSENTAYQPKNVIAFLCEALKRVGYEGKTNYQRRSIRIDFSDGMSLDVVPVVQAAGKDDPLIIPDRKLEKWIETHPKGHLQAATQLNKDSGGLYKPFVKLVKAWFRYQMHDVCKVERPKPKGFTLEAMVAQYWDSDAPSYAEAFVNFLQAIQSRSGTSLARGEFPLVPDPGMPGRYLGLNISAAEAKQFGQLVASTLAQAKEAMGMRDDDRSAKMWRGIFGPKFPTADAMKQKSASFAATTVTRALAEEEDAWEERIAGSEIPTRSALPGYVRIAAEVYRTQNGTSIGRYPSDGWPLPKRTWLRFYITATDVQPPFEVRWTVENHGKDAYDDHVKNGKDLTYTRSTGNVREYWRETAYRGKHFLICELIKDDKVVAKTKFKVNVNHTQQAPG